MLVERARPGATTTLEVALPGAPRRDRSSVTTQPALAGAERVRIATVSDLHLGLHTFGLLKTDP